MKIKEFRVNSDQEVILKVTKEVLLLFHFEFVAAEPDILLFSVRNSRRGDSIPEITTEVELCWTDGSKEKLVHSDIAGKDEHEKAAVHRLVKLNLYHLLRQRFAFASAPWGILHGVRPTKIVHRYIEQGLSASEIIERLAHDYDVSNEKAVLITKLAFRQLPFLATGRPRLVSIYLGIPFCLSRCLYCSFPSYVLPDKEKLAAFMSVWQHDLLTAAKDVARYGLQVQNIYIGGGTPTSLPDEIFAEMLRLVYNSFYGSAAGEFTVEAGRPDSISAAKIEAMKRYKVDRVSVNPQTMQEKTLRLIGRQHTPRDIVDMFQRLRLGGLEHINMDVIIGLPGEDEADMADTIGRVLALEPDDITLHALALKRGSRLKEQLQTTPLPDDATARRMFSLALKAVEEKGFQPYYLYRQGYMSGQLENIGCCKTGAESMYNIQIMEENQTIIGIGPAAVTKVPGGGGKRLHSSFNAKDLISYVRDIDRYIEKRADLLHTAYGKEEDNISC